MLLAIILISLFYIQHFIELFLLLNVFNVRGKVYFKIAFKNNKVLLNLFIQFIMALFVATWTTYDYSKYKFNIWILIMINGIFIVRIIVYILCIKKYGVITTKGIIRNKRFFKWEDIQNYDWIDTNSIKINMKNQYTDKKYQHNEIFKNLIVSKDKLDLILKEHLKPTLD